MSSAPYKRITLFGNIPVASWLPACSLTLLIFPSKVYSILISPDDRIIFCQVYIRDKSTPFSMFLRYLFLGESFLRGIFLEINIYEIESPFIFVPLQFSQETHQLELVHALIDDSLFEKEYTSQWIRQEGVEVLFVPQEGLQQVLKQFIPHFTFRHISAENVKIARRLGQVHTSLLLLQMSESRLVATVIKEKQLYLCQSYFYNTLLDAIYFIQLVKEVADWEEDSVPTFIMGEIEKPEEPNTGLWQYLPGLQITPPQIFRLDSHEKIAEWWKYGFINGGR